jgi:hypothetical protein
MVKIVINPWNKQQLSSYGQPGPLLGGMDGSTMEPNTGSYLSPELCSVSVYRMDTMSSEILNNINDFFTLDVTCKTCQWINSLHPFSNPVL